MITRASVNTLIGLGGLIDVAGYEGIAYEQEDFGHNRQGFREFFIQITRFFQAII